ncbi:bifunctional metallophosphatase/5'-nucleotidase [Streptomyces sp. RFCAC02]|uniref:bifunctional metallophosphatase/5'-nucleotidase n=1 Tax=Streptomyces sp. RFCAC02 TaxID=2499143 RepID=UPI00101EFBE5|nr:bifunctional metallophosphatase/5'-nucleotidase [Streptomyces sp. RFCAC02]
MQQSRHTRHRRRALGLTAGASLLAVLGSLAAAPPGAHGEGGHGNGGGRTVDLQLLALNDLHGALEPPTGSNGQVVRENADGTTQTVTAGGAAYLASALRDARRGESRSLTVAAGDLIGASPLLSGLFHDEPTVEALNALDLDVTSVGNHEFDEGWTELTRLQDGGCHPVDGCYTEGRTFDGADFPYLAANVVDGDTGEPILAPYSIQRVNGVAVGFIGVTLEGTADIVTQAGIEGLEFRDEVETIDRYAAELERRGVHAIVALVHEGGYPAAEAYNHDCDGADGGLSGPVTDIAGRADPAVDVLITGHTHQPYVCTIPDPAGTDRLVTSAASNGRLFTELTMDYDRRTRDIVRASVAGSNRVVDRERTPASDLTALIEEWNALAAPVADAPIGWISEDIAGRGSGLPEFPLGDLIADAQLAHARGIDPDTDLALMNPGGVRADLVHAASGAEGDGVVTYGEGFAVQPFANTVNLIDLTGDQLLRVLREQVSGGNEAVPKILQPSDGLAYTLDPTASGADRIVAGSVRVAGEPLDPGATYRVAVNSFLAGGGDGFATLAEGTDPVVGEDDMTALADYLTAHSSPGAPLAAPAADRITVVGQP